MRLVFKHFPLPFHDNAVLASKAALAAGAQGRFWEMHDLIFENNKGLNQALLKRLAGRLKLNMKQFEKDLGSKQSQKLIDRTMEEGQEVGVRGTPNVFFNGRLVKGARPYDVIRPLVEEELNKGRQLKAKGVKIPYDTFLAQGTTFSAVSDVVLDIDTKDAPAKGTGSQLEIVVFSEFQCPYCRRIKPALDGLLGLFGGRARLVFKHFPLDRHENAHLAAQATMAAHAQGRFWEMHDLLFAARGRMGREDLVGYASQIGLDVARFTKELDDGTWKRAVDADIRLGRSLGVRGTPTIFFNGQKYLGAGRTPEELAKDIDKYVLGR